MGFIEQGGAATAVRTPSPVRDVAAAAHTLARGMAGPERFVRELLGQAGITIDGSAPHDITVHDRRFYRRVARDGSLGLGESYMDGWWDCPAIDQMIARIHRANLPASIRRNWRLLLTALQARLLNLQSVRRAFEVGRRHYDIGNDLYRAMLDRRMVYTCAYWNGAKTLEQAQEAKLELICRKLGLRPGMRVLELGCGWGSFARYAAENYGVEVTGYTVSEEQVAMGREVCAGLPVELRLDDYRNARGTYDRVLSIGIMEHVGPRNYRTYMEVVDRCLAPGGCSLIHTIGGNLSEAASDPWTHRYIFPNGRVPSVAQLSRAMEGLFTFQDLHAFGPHYDPTLMAWYRNFVEAWPALRDKYGDRFYRLWSYYLLMSAAAFRTGYLTLFQIVMSRPHEPALECRQS
ncbi:MAG TPA: cyclopropane fatty acyl phospholipid synthase [Longimicrobium sp.]|nr:cyclopropane fatty acyl phospholipid synthase [Longimicrobium sp.]